MKKFDKIKTFQLILFILFAAVALVTILRDAELFALIATNGSARLLSMILWLVLGASFLFLLYDFNSYADMKRENTELDNAVYSDALTGVANRYSLDAYIGRFLGKPLPEDMGAVTVLITNLKELNEILGHGGGDLAIQAFSGILQDAAPDAGFIGRNGGNKFVVIFRNCTRERIESFREAVSAAVAGRNAAHTGAELRFAFGAACNEGPEVSSVNALVALSDRRAS